MWRSFESVWLLQHRTLLYAQPTIASSSIVVISSSEFDGLVPVFLLNFSSQSGFIAKRKSTSKRNKNWNRLKKYFIIHASFFAISPDWLRKMELNIWLVLTQAKNNKNQRKKSFSRGILWPRFFLVASLWHFILNLILLNKFIFPY